MKKKIFYIYGILNYGIMLGVFLYLIGFVTGFLVPKSIDSGNGGALFPSLLINLGLITLFGLQHSIMARPAFKKKWKKLVPAPIERSTFILFTNLMLILLFWLWQPMPGIVWSVQAQPFNFLLWFIGGLGWVFTFLSTELINKKHFFGLQQVGEYLHDKKLSSPEFQTPLFYRIVRHPMMLGFLIAFWVTPHMTAGHLLFAGIFTIYILTGLRLEENDLIEFFGDRYRRYQRQVARLIPGFKFKRADPIGSEMEPLTDKR